MRFPSRIRYRYLLAFLSVLFCINLFFHPTEAHAVVPTELPVVKFPPFTVVDEVPSPDVLTPQDEVTLFADAILARYPKNLTRAKAQKVAQLVHHYAQLKELPVITVLGIIDAESAYRAGAVSTHGARGIMQVMPKVHAKKFKGRSPHDIEASIDVGTTVLQDCLRAANNNMRRGLGCYNGATTTKAINRYVHKISLREQYYAKQLAAMKPAYLLANQ